MHINAPHFMAELYIRTNLSDSYKSRDCTLLQTGFNLFMHKDGLLILGPFSIYQSALN